MSNPPAAFRSLIIYLICIPLALLLGYMLTSPLQWSSFGTVGIVLGLLVLPVLLRYHHPLLILGWGCTMIVFFLPGAPHLWIPLVAISLAISVVQRTIDPDYRFISIPSLTWSLLAVAAVVLFTAEATGGIHLRSMSGGREDVYGGKRYIEMLVAIAGYFAITAQRIPIHRSRLYIALFLLGGATALIGDALYFNNSSLQIIYWFFPPDTYVLAGGGLLARFRGLAVASVCVVYLMLARYGIRGVFSARYPWRTVLFAGCLFTSLFGGFRAILVTLMLLLCILFFLEGLHRTKFLPILFLGGILVAVVTLPFVRYFPYAVQRTLSILPINVEPAARIDAQASTEWRLQLWKAMLPEVPQYLLLGKGLALTRQDFDFSLNQNLGSIHAFSEQDTWAALAADYHNGPLSILIPFGLWGALAFLWFIAAGWRALYRNYRYGDPELHKINTFLLALFVARTLMFFIIYGSFYGDLRSFVGYVAVSVCLNGGVARPVPEPVRDLAEAKRVPQRLPQPSVAQAV